MVDTLLSDCVIAFVGIPGRLDGTAPDERVLRHPGADAAVLSRVRAVLADVDAVEPPLHLFEDLAEMRDAVIAFLRSAHPELSTAAMTAVASTFTYGWKENGLTTTALTHKRLSSEPSLASAGAPVRQLPGSALPRPAGHAT